MRMEDKPYRAVMTNEPFLFHEMRITARLLNAGMSDDEVIDRIIKENLFQYPTEKSLRRMARPCVQRLRGLDDATLIDAVATQPQNVAKQICLYAMMKQYRLMNDFMITVVGAKYRQQDLRLRRMDVNVFFLRLQEQDEGVAAWSAATVTKLSQVIMKTLVENEYLDNLKAERLNPVLLSKVLEDAIREHGDEIMLPAFNRFD